MTASIPDPERPTAQEDLDGREPESGSLLGLPDEHLPYVKGGKAELARRRSSRYYSQEFNLTGTPEPMTPQEKTAREQGFAKVRDERLRREARQADTPLEQYDDIRRGNLRWAAALVGAARQAEGAAHILDKDADPWRENMGLYESPETARKLANERRANAGALVLSACRICIFEDRCGLVWDPGQVVSALEDKGTRRQFVEVMSGGYGSSYVSCESVIDPND